VVVTKEGVVEAMQAVNKHTLSSSSVMAFQAPAMAPMRSAAASSVNMAVYSWSQPGEGATWDPLGLAKTPEKFERLRYVEVKHGRIAMLACLGQFVVGSGYRFPGELANSVQFSTIEGNGYAALKQLSPVDLALIFVSVGFLETRVMKEVVKGEFPGDLRNGLFTEGWDGFSEADKKRKINIELNNGRAAMMGIAGMMVHESLGVSPFFPQTPLN